MYACMHIVVSYRIQTEYEPGIRGIEYGGIRTVCFEASSCVQSHKYGRPIIRQKPISRVELNFKRSIETRSRKARICDLNIYHS